MKTFRHATRFFAASVMLLAGGLILGAWGPDCSSLPNGDRMFFINPNDCSEYCVCEGGVRHNYRCPDDLLFCPQLEACAYSWNLRCAFCSDEYDGQLRDHYLSCVDGGIEIVVVPAGGTVTILGVTVTGNAGSTITVVWERWQCQLAAGQTCDMVEQGVKVTKI